MGGVRGASHVHGDGKGDKNEMNRALGHLICAQIGSTGPGEPPEDDEMNEMTLPSRHRITGIGGGEGCQPCSR